MNAYRLIPLLQINVARLVCLLGIILLLTTLITPGIGSKNRRQSREKKHRDRTDKRQTDRYSVSWDPQPPVGPPAPDYCSCSWEYYDHEDAQRIPRHLHFARCTNPNDDCRDSSEGSCHLHNYTVAVLRRSSTASRCRDSLDDYEVAYESVPVACVCVLPDPY
ncbi:uncharacterized protein LOC119728119 [Patiria miniata]|uniref:Uncharacterized protein n=1 Tax=Patiria miniata TaxID=46514 RepID=A0A913ZWU8_PATMI|nr:uncharacterized protein LOC119728119 [Patiria miniata]